MSKKAIKLDNVIYGNKNINTAHTYHNIAGAYANSRDIEKAEEYYRKAIEVKSELLGLDNYDTLISVAGLGNILKKNGNT